MQAKNEISAIIRKILAETGMTHAALADAIGVNEDRVTSLATGRVKKLHPSELTALVQKMGVSMVFLETGEAPIFQPRTREPGLCLPPDTPKQAISYSNTEGARRLIADDFVTVPRYDVHGSAGAGAVIHSEQIVDYLAFRADWVHNALGVSAAALALISVKGDSMEPTLSNGDLILLDTSHGRIEDNAIYALQHNGTLLVKRIQRRMDGSVAVKSDNPRYEPESLTADQAGALKVVGRVVWSGRRM